MRPRFEGIDQIPIMDGERTVAVWERVGKRKRPLHDSLLVSADAPLWDFIHTVHEQAYRLVADKTKIAGIVTWSDLLKVPVFVLAFSLLAELELAMNSRILDQYKDDSWVDLLINEEEKQRIRGRQQSRKYANLGLPAVEAAHLWHKATILPMPRFLKGRRVACAAADPNITGGMWAEYLCDLGTVRENCSDRPLQGESVVENQGVRPPLLEGVALPTHGRSYRAYD